MPCVDLLACDASRPDFGLTSPGSRPRVVRPVLERKGENLGTGRGHQGRSFVWAFVVNKRLRSERRQKCLLGRDYWGFRVLGSRRLRVSRYNVFVQMRGRRVVVSRISRTGTLGGQQQQQRLLHKI